MLAKFPLGRTVGTPAALAALDKAGKSHQDILDAHAWQLPELISELQRTENLHAIENGERVISDFTMPDGEVVRVATVHDRSYTTIMLPEED